MHLLDLALRAVPLGDIVRKHDLRHLPREDDGVRSEMHLDDLAVALAVLPLARIEGLRVSAECALNLDGRRALREHVERHQQKLLLRVAVVAHRRVVHRTDVERLQVHDEHGHRIVLEEIPVGDLGVLQRLLGLLALHHLDVQFTRAGEHAGLQFDLRLAQLVVALLDLGEHLVEGHGQPSHFVIAAFFSAQRVVVPLGDGIRHPAKVRDGVRHEPLQQAEEHARDQCRDAGDNERHDRIPSQSCPQRREARVQPQRPDPRPAIHHRFEMLEPAGIDAAAGRQISTDAQWKMAMHRFR